jgi:hypothetical protein
MLIIKILRNVLCSQCLKICSLLEKEQSYHARNCFLYKKEIHQVPNLHGLLFHKFVDTEVCVFLISLGTSA